MFMSLILAIYFKAGSNLRDFDYNQMKQGELYLQKGIKRENSSLKGKKKAELINGLSIEKREEIVSLEKELLGNHGEELYITPPLYVSYGDNIKVGENFYANKDCIFMDTNNIEFGDNVIVGPRCCFYCAGHPIYGDVRSWDNDYFEFGLPIKVGNDVWIGGNVVILPGITIGNGSVIGAGAVVTKNVPSEVIVAGNPAVTLRKITEEDKKRWETLRKNYYEKREEFYKNHDI